MKVVVLGDGLLGSELVKLTGWDCISRKQHGFDITNEESYNDFSLQNYDAIVNCIAYTNTYSDDKDSNWNVNYKAVVSLADYCKSHGVKLVHISTDYVYANSKPAAAEQDVPVHLSTWYGYTKLLGDAYAQLNESNLVIRTSHKPYPFPYSKAWSDQHSNGDYVPVIADLIIKLVKKDVQGLINVGTTTKTWYSLTKGEFNTEPMLRSIGAPEDITMDITNLTSKLQND
jgi:dTDP-4-dehydrorhamnose reductase